MTGHGGVIRSVQVSPDGVHALTASFDHSLRLWRVDDQSTVKVLEGHDGPVNAARFVPGKDMAVSAGADGRVIFWNLKEGQPHFVRDAHAGRAMSVAIGPGGNAALTGGWDGALLLWDIETGSLIKRIDAKVPLVAVGFGGDGSTLIAADRSGALHLYRAADGIQTARRSAHEIGMTDMVASENGNHLLSIGLDNLARVWSLPGLDPIVDFLPTPEVKPLSIALSQDGKSMLVGYIDGSVLHLDSATGKELRALNVEKPPVWSLGFSRDGAFALIADGSERVGVWHLATGDRISIAGEAAGDRPMPWLESDHPGAQLFRKCANCHALTDQEPQRSGPHFAGLFGRAAGSVSGYRYSSALQKTQIIWDQRSLRQLFELGPDKLLPGTKMPVQRVTNPIELDALVAYLRIITPPR